MTISRQRFDVVDRPGARRSRLLGLGLRQRGEDDTDAPPPLSKASTTIAGGDAPPLRPVRQPPREPADIAERLKVLSSEQLAEVVSTFTDQVKEGDDAAKRRALAKWVEESGDDAVEDKDEGTDETTARAAGRADAIAYIEQEMFAVVSRTTPRSEWRRALGVSEQRLRELASFAADAAALNKE